MQAHDGLLCAVDDDGCAGVLVAATRRLADMTGLRPLFVHACEAPAAVGGAQSALRRLGTRTAEQRIAVGDPEIEVLASAREEDPALAIVAAGTRGRIAGAVPGGVATALARHAPCPVIVLPPGLDTTFGGGPIVCAVSVGERDEDAIRFAGALARLADRRLVLSHALRAQDAALVAAERASAQALAGEGAHAAVATADATTSAAVDARAGAVAGRLVTLARDAAADLLVVGAQRNGAVAEALFGPVARTLWARAPCPIALTPN